MKRYMNAKEILGLSALAGIVAVSGVLYHKHTSHSPPTQVQAYASTNSYPVPASVNGTNHANPQFGEDTETHAFPSHLLYWQGKPFVIETNRNPSPGALNWIVKDAQASNLEGTKGPHALGVVSGTIYEFLPLTNMTRGKPVQTWFVATNGPDANLAQRTYLAPITNKNGNGISLSGIEAKMQKPLDTWNLFGTGFYFRPDNQPSTNVYNLQTNALPFAVVPTNATRVFLSTGQLMLKAPENQAAAYRAVAVPELDYHLRTPSVPVQPSDRPGN